MHACLQLITYTMWTISIGMGSDKDVAFCCTYRKFTMMWCELIIAWIANILRIIHVNIVYCNAIGTKAVRAFDTRLQTLASAVEFLAEFTLPFDVFLYGVKTLIARYCQDLQIALFLLLLFFDYWSVWIFGGGLTRLAGWSTWSKVTRSGK